MRKIYFIYKKIFLNMLEFYKIFFFLKNIMSFYLIFIRINVKLFVLMGGNYLVIWEFLSFNEMRIKLMCFLYE